MRVTPLQRERARERARKDTAPDGTELLADGRVRVLSKCWVNDMWVRIAPSHLSVK
jgi:hypothetical protein